MSEEKALYHPRRTTNYKIIVRALELLNSGILANNVPERLSDEFGLNPERAKELTDKSIELHKMPGKRGKLDTKPFDPPRGGEAL